MIKVKNENEPQSVTINQSTKAKAQPLGSKSNELVQLKRAVGVHAQFEWPKLPRSWSGSGLGLGLGLGLT